MIPQNLLPEGTNYFIAGGYAACPGLAGDIDVWVTEWTPEDAIGARKEILLHLVQNDFDLRIEENDAALVRAVAYPDECVTSKVARVAVKEMLPIHIMIASGSAERVLEGFDVSTHAIAIHKDGRVIKHKEWTPINVMPKVLRQNPGTPARMERICSRYKLPNPLLRPEEHILGED